MTVITGDIHTAWAADLKADWSDQASQTLGTEYICTSVTAGGAEDVPTFLEDFLPESPHIKYFDPRHGGYTGVVLTPDTWTASFFHVDDMRQQGSAVTEISTWVTEAGNPGAKQA